ncbi:site-specific integrase [Aeromonas hydrophila]|nr:site-specific integrase [Aeromonas hydrophila]QBX76634.1 site-specific integrase [Aeromonas hydrophila]
MRSMSNLIQNRYGKWYARLVIPKALRPVIQKGELKRSLNTTIESEARRAALPVLDEFYRLLEAAKIDLVVQPLDLSNAADCWYNVMIERLDEPDVRARFIPLQDTGSTIEPADILQTLLADVERGQPGLSDKDKAARLARFLMWMKPYTDEALQASGLCLFVGSANYQALARLLAGKFLQLSVAVQQNTRTNAMQRRIGQPEIPLVPTGNITVPTISPRGTRLSALFERYKATIKRREPKKADTRILEYQVAVERFIELMGDKGIEDITKRDVAEFRNLMEQLPARPKRHVSAMPLRQQIACAEEHNLPRLTAATVKKLGRALSAVLGNAVEDGLLEHNPAHGAKYTESVINPLAEPERPYTSTELATMFGSPLFARRTQHARFGEAHYWVPLMLYYTGARAEEVCQLYVADVIQQDGVWFFRVAELRGDQSVKNRSSNRDIPVHPHLLTLGLLDYLRSLPADGRLFPLLNPSGPKQSYHVRLGVWWQRHLREKLKITREDIQPFHSFRHTFITLLRTAEVREDVQNAITGHSQHSDRTATGRNYGAYTLSQKLAAVEAIPLAPIPTYDEQLPAETQ